MTTLVQDSTIVNTNNNLNIQNNKMQCLNKKKKKKKKFFNSILKQILKPKSSGTEKDKQKILDATGGATFRRKCN